MENYSFLVDVKLLLRRILDSNLSKLVCKFYVKSPHFHAKGPKFSLHHLWKMPVGKHNCRANSEIGYIQNSMGMLTLFGFNGRFVPKNKK